MKPGKTRRQQMTDLLQRKSWSVYELAEEFGVKISTILDDLEHIRSSVSSRYRIQILPQNAVTVALSSKKSKLPKPSRCPKCKSEWVSPPMMRTKLA